jgi:hypothetical protein
MTADHILENWEEGFGLVDLKELAGQARLAYKTYSKQRQEIGTEAHELIERFIAHQVDDTMPYPKIDNASAMAQSCFLRFEDWCDKHFNEIEWVFAERKVLSVTNMFCGTADNGFRFNGQLYVGDVKTGKRVYGEAGVQAASYKNCLAEELGGDWKYAGRAIFHIPAGGRMIKLLLEPEISKLTGHSIQEDYAAFLNMLEVYKWQDIQDPLGGPDISPRDRPFQVTVDLIDSHGLNRLDDLCGLLGGKTKSDAVRYAIEWACLGAQMTPVAGQYKSFNGLTQAIKALTSKVEDITPYVRKTKAPGTVNKKKPGKVTADDRALLVVWKKALGIDPDAQMTIFWPPIIKRTHTLVGQGVSYQEMSEMLEHCMESQFIAGLVADGQQPYISQILSEKMIPQLQEIVNRKKNKAAEQFGNSPADLVVVKGQVMKRLWDTLPEKDRSRFKTLVGAAPNMEALRKVEAQFSD